MEFGAGVGFNDILAFGIFSAIPRAVCRAAARWGALKNRDLATADDDVGGPIYLDYNATTPVYAEVAAAMLPYLMPAASVARFVAPTSASSLPSASNDVASSRVATAAPTVAAASEYGQAALLPAAFGNPSSGHALGARSREALGGARADVALLLNASHEDEIIFTSCGSESDNWAIRIALENYKAQERRAYASPPHVVTSAIEHPAVLAYLRRLESEGELTLTVLGVDREGAVDVRAVAAALTPNTCLVTIMHSNNEIGTIQPVADIARVIRNFRSDGVMAMFPLFHSDAAQSVGRVAVDVAAWGVDMLTVVGHKCGAPKGVAALFVRRGVPVKSWIVGGGQECGRRAGTENTMLIAGLGAAAKLATSETMTIARAREGLLHSSSSARGREPGPGLAREEEEEEDKEEESLLLRQATAHTVAARTHLLESRICVLVEFAKLDKDHCLFNGPKVLSDVNYLQALLLKLKESPIDLEHIRELESLAAVGLLNTISVSFRGVRSSQLVHALASKVACSGGSACHSEEESVSHVLNACGVPREFSMGTLRLSLGRYLAIDQTRRAVVAIIEAVTERKRTCNE